ncbi:cadherin-87A-like isoform X2 [Ornithodoros turicata]
MALTLFGIALICVLHTSSANQPPKFTNTIDLTVVSENTPIGTSIFRLEGFDPEKSPVYFGIEGTDLLTVDKDTGVVTVRENIDREKTETIRFSVTLQDIVGGNHDNNMVKVPVSVIVLDVNDNAPRFENQPYEVKLSEDALPGHTVLTDIRVSDVDAAGSVLQVHCESNHQSPDSCDNFAVSILESSPQRLRSALILRKPVDYTEKPVHEVQLVANDGLFNTTAVAIVKVMDVQNRPPVFVGPTAAIVREDVPVGTLVLVVKAVDGDHGVSRAVQYALVSNPEQFFVINKYTGDITTARPLDREVLGSPNGVVTVTVKASEVEGGEVQNDTDSQTVTTVEITIRDVNDEPPTFSQPSYTVNVNENIPNGSPLPNLDIFVQDTDAGSNSVFNIGLVDASGMFTVEPTIATGSTSVSIRIVRGPLDFENPNHRKFILLVAAEEAFTSPKLSSTATVTVNVIDVNDNPPVFDRDSYSAVVAEDAPPGSVVTTIVASDRDSGAYGEAGLVYSLLGNGAEKFFVSPSSGVVTVAPCETPGNGNCLDFETRSSYFLSYQATDDNGKGHTVVVPLTITLSDSNDNPPVFEQKVYAAAIDEGDVRFDVPLKVQAKDADVTSFVKYSLVSGNGYNLFSINPQSGEITVSSRSGLDVSLLKTDVIKLIVQASDGGTGIDTAEVQITVRDANNNSPIFQRREYYASVAEVSPPGTLVEQVSATDADTGVNALITYRIQKGAFDDFVIDGSTGVVSLSPNSKLDYDRRKHYVMEIIGVDSGVPEKTGTATLSVNILNSNDKMPYFQPTTQRAQVFEGADIGNTFYKLIAKDPDASSEEYLKYSIMEPITAIAKDGRSVNASVQAYKGFFGINSDTGEISVSSPINRDIAAVVTLSTVVTDVSAVPYQTGIGTLVVTIVDLNDFPPSFPPPWSPSHPELHITVMEEQPVGSIVASFVATDPDSNIASYTIEPESPYFSVDKHSGVVTIKSRVDYEKVQDHVFSVVVRDTGIPQLSAIARVTATIININDNDPIFIEKSYHAKVQENAPQGTFVTQVKANDIDTGEFGVVSYSLLGERSPDFSVDDRGEIRVAGSANLDRELTMSITLQVVATDMGQDVSTRRSVSVPVYLTLLDDNDSPPVFSKKTYEASFVANSPLESAHSIVQVSATDADEGINAAIRYSILAGNEHGQFAVNPKTGVVYPVTALDGHKKEYRLSLEARDGDGEGPNTDTCVIVIRLIEINLDKPHFITPALPNATVEILENQTGSNVPILTVAAVDSDRGDNGRLSYFFKLGDRNVKETDEFVIDAVTGEIKMKVGLDRETRPRYELVLVARDHGSPSQFETLRFLTVVLKDIDDNVPLFPRTPSTTPYVFHVKENLNTGFHVGQVTAVDNDVGENAMVYYYIIDGNWHNNFVIDKLHGIIYSNTSFDREEKNTYEMVVKATSNPDYMVYNRQDDGLLPSMRTYSESDRTVALVHVIVDDVNDNPPVFVNAPYYSGLRFTAVEGDTVFTVKAVDADEHRKNDTSVEYRVEYVTLFLPGAKGGIRPIPASFNISQDGRVCATHPMAQYSQARFVIALEAKETEPPHRAAHTALKVWVYEPDQLVRVVIAQPPQDVYTEQREVAALLSNATGGTVVIDNLKYHVSDKGKLMKTWTDLYIHVLDENDKVIQTPKVLEAVDSNSKLVKFQNPELQIHNILPAHSGVTKEEFDLALAVLIAMLVVIFIGVITMMVCCRCLRSWYALKVKEAFVRQDDVQPVTTTENPLWTEQKLKIYEEQELSMSVAPDNIVTTEADIAAFNFNDDTNSALYATLRRSSIGCATTDPRNDYATLNGQQSNSNAMKRQRTPDPIENHEYHELRHNNAQPSGDTTPFSTFRPPDRSSKAAKNSPSHQRNTSGDNEPVLIAELL